MKFDILNRFSGAVQFTAEIDCSDDASTSVRVGLSVLWGVKNGANLRDANLRGADLRDANLRDANLRGADLRGADLSDADLRGADLRGADLRGADLSGADLSDANLRGADLRGADLRGADLRGADLSGADLSDANLRGADLSDADLSDANLRGADLSDADLSGAYLSGANGVNDYIKCIQIDTYPINYTAEVMQIGCQRHGLTEWAEFSDAQIRAMDGVKALEWWKKYSAWIFATIELCPAKATKEAAQ